MSKPPRNGVPGREGQAVADRPPEQRDQAGDAHALRHDREHVLAAHEAAVEERETRQRHEQHQRGADHHEAVVAGAGRHDLRGLVVGASAVVHVRFEIGDALLQVAAAVGSRSGRRRFVGKGGWGCDREPAGT